MAERMQAEQEQHISEELKQAIRPQRRKSRQRPPKVGVQYQAAQEPRIQEQIEEAQRKQEVKEHEEWTKLESQIRRTRMEGKVPAKYLPPEQREFWEAQKEEAIIRRGVKGLTRRYVAGTATVAEYKRLAAYAPRVAPWVEYDEYADVKAAEREVGKYSRLSEQELWDIISSQPSGEELSPAFVTRHQAATKEYYSRFTDPKKTYAPFTFEAIQRAPPSLARKIAKEGETPSGEDLWEQYVESYQKTWKEWQRSLPAEDIKPFEMPEVPLHIGTLKYEPWPGAGSYLLPTARTPVSTPTKMGPLGIERYPGLEPPTFKGVVSREELKSIERISEYALQGDIASERIEEAFGGGEVGQFIAGASVGWAEDLWEGITRLAGAEEYAPSEHKQPVWKFRGGIAWKPGFEEAMKYEAGTLPGARLPSEPWKDIGKIVGWTWGTAGLIKGVKLGARGAFRFGERFIGKPIMARMAPWQRAPAEVLTYRTRQLGPAISETFIGRPTELITRRPKGELAWHPLRGESFIKTTAPGKYITAHRGGLFSWAIEPFEVILKRGKPFWLGPKGEMLTKPPEHYLWRLAGIKGTVRRVGPFATQDIDLMIRNLGRISPQEAARIPSLLDISRTRILGITRTKGWYQVPQLGVPQKGLLGHPYTPRVAMGPDLYIGSSRIGSQSALLAMQDIETMWGMGQRMTWGTGTKLTTMFRKGFPGTYLRTETLFRPTKTFYPAPVFGAEELGLIWKPGAYVKTRGFEFILGKEPMTRKVARTAWGTFEPRWTQMSLTGQPAAYRIGARGISILPEFPGTAKISFETYPYMFEKMAPATMGKTVYLPTGKLPSPWKFSSKVEKALMGLGKQWRADVMTEPLEMPFAKRGIQTGAGWFQTGISKAATYTLPIVTTRAYAPITLGAGAGFLGSAIGGAVLGGISVGATRETKSFLELGGVRDVSLGAPKSLAVPEIEPITKPSRKAVEIPVGISAEIPAEVPAMRPFERAAKVPIIQPFEVPVSQAKERASVMEKAAQVAITKAVTIERGMGRGVGRGMPVPAHPLIPTEEPVEKKKRVGLGKGFIPQVRRGGKWISLTGRPVTKDVARALGAKEAIETPVRSFRVQPSEESPVRMPKPSLPAFWQRMFRKPKSRRLKEAEAWVEKSKFAIDRPGEISGITAKGLKALSLFPELRKKKKRRRKRR